MNDFSVHAAMHAAVCPAVFIVSDKASAAWLLKAKDMHRMPPTTEPRSGNYLDETVFWIIAAEQEREATQTHTSPRARHGRSSNTQFRARGFAESVHRPLIRIVSLQTGSTTSSAYRDATGGAMRVLSA
jgi:hypothetical protein